jgi:putative membrane protein
MKAQAQNRFSGGAAVQLILLAGLSASLALLLSTGLVGHYLHPRFNPLLACSSVFLALLAAARVPRLFTRHPSPPVRLEYLIFALVVILIFPSAGASIDQAIAALRGVSVDGSPYYTGDGNEPAAPLETGKEPPAGKETDVPDAAASPDKNASPVPDPLPDSACGTPADGAVVQADYETFVPALNELFDFPEEYAGRHIRIRGFKFTARDFPSGQFLIARMGITCCAADAQAMGIMCRYPGHARLKENGWYELYGVIRTEPGTNVLGESRLWPYIEVEEHVAVSPPADPYVYPYQY